MGGPHANLNPQTEAEEMEEFEEGEISDEDQSQASGSKREVPLLQKRVSLDDLLSLAQSQRKLELLRSRDEREARARDDNGKARWEEERAWRRDSVPYAATSGSSKSYASNLYNLAWAQAVKEGPVAGVGGLTRSNSRKLDHVGNGTQTREYEDDAILNGRSSSSAMRWKRETENGRDAYESGTSYRGSRENSTEKGVEKTVDKPSSGFGEVSGMNEANGSLEMQSATVDECVKDGQHEGEGREEGELEEGEIELACPPSSTGQGVDLQAPADRRVLRERLDFSRGRGVDRSDCGYGGRERATWRNVYVEHPKHQVSRDVDFERALSRDRWEREKHRPREAEAEKVELENLDERKLTFDRKDLVSMVSKLVKNVSVKDAQKSFSGVCKRLCKALKLLDELCSVRDDAQAEGATGKLPSDVAGLARQAFAGIRSVFTIRNTASGREQERDKELFPRLLDLATGLCPKLFKKETRELEGMRQSIVKASHMLVSQGGVGSSAVDVKHGDVAENWALGTVQVESVVSRLSADADAPAQTRADGKVNQLADPKQAADAAAIAAAAIAYAQSSAAALASPPADDRYMNCLSQMPGVRMGRTSSPWPWPDSSQPRGPSKAQAIGSSSSGGGGGSSGGQMVTAAMPTLSSLSDVASRPTSAVVPTYKPWTEPERQLHVVDYVNKGWASSGIPGPALAVQSMPLSLGGVAQQHGNATYKFQNFEDEWEEMSPPGNAWYLSSATSGTSAELGKARAASSWLPRLEQHNMPPYRSGILPNSMFPGDRLPSPTPSDEDDDDDDDDEPGDGSGGGKDVSQAWKMAPSMDALGSSTSGGGARQQPSWKAPLFPMPQVPAVEVREVEAGSAPAVFKATSSSSVARMVVAQQAGREAEHVVHEGSSLTVQVTRGGGVGTRKQEAMDFLWETGGDAKRQRVGAVTDFPAVLGQGMGKGTTAEAVSGGWLDDGQANDVMNLHAGPVDMEVDEEKPAQAAARSEREEGISSECVEEEAAEIQKAGSGDAGHIRSGDFVADNESVEVESPAVELEKPPTVDEEEQVSEKAGKAATTGRKQRHRGGSQVHPDLEQLLEGLDDAERTAVQQERERRMAEQERMFSARKLCLVLDLDHTLLNSAKFSEIEAEWEHRLRASEAAERSRVGREGRRELYRFVHMSMWTKLRPGIWNFLAKASELYELHVYTMGNKVYATEMAKLLDPTGELFAGRVISKGDDADAAEGDEKVAKSKDLDGVMGMESGVVIIDDSVRVWPHQSQNLIVVERYMYFPCSRRQFGLSGPSLLEVGHDERETDGMLASALAVISRIHSTFFSHQRQRLREVDVRTILASEQRSVLGGCRIVFSRVFPVGELQPQSHPLWRMAEQFGAVCTSVTDDEVTHVVAISLGTDKVNWAQATGRHVVRPAWIEASAVLYRRANERDFALLS